MTAALVAPVAQVCAFALGCALIHAARAHAEILTHMLAGAVIVAAALLLLAASLAYVPDEPEAFDDVSAYAAV